MVLTMTLAGAGCSARSTANTSTKSPTVAASRYLEIARTGNEQLEDEIDALTGPDRDHLSSARRDLRDAAATERTFDRHLLEIDFLPATRAIADRLYAVNQTRAALSAEAAQSLTVAQLRDFEGRINTANGQVEKQVRLIRAALHLPPPSSS